VKDHKYRLVVADRNSNVREFLRRELIAEGYLVSVARDEAELQVLLNDGPPDLLILDLEIPHAGGVVVLERLERRMPHLPIIIHTFPVDEANHPTVRRAAALVEKSADTGRLKSEIGRILKDREAEAERG